MQPVKAKWIPVYFAQCWELNQNIQIQNGLDALMLSTHALGEEREGKGRGDRGGEGRGEEGEAKRKGKEKREEKKDTFIGE